MSRFATMAFAAAPGALLFLNRSPGAPLDADAKKLEQGLTLRIDTKAEKPTGALTDFRDARLVMLRVENGTAPTPFVGPGPFRATWEGFINVNLRGEYRFTFAGSGVVSLVLNDKVVLENAGDNLAEKTSDWVTLQKGKNALQVIYDSPFTGDAWIRMSWQEKDSPMEAVGPEAFSHHAANPKLIESRQMRSARELVADLRCFKCHSPGADLKDSPVSMPELKMDAPDLSDVGARLNAGWIAKWVANPHAIRPDTTMPQLPHDNDASLIAEYLASLGKQNDKRVAADEAIIAAGGRLFIGLGCIACHSITNEKNAVERISLLNVKAKFQPPALKRFLLNPQERFAFIKMPNPRLTDEEADKISAFLISRCKDGPPEDPSTADGKEKGKQLVSSLGCLNCHTLKLDNTFKAAPWEQIAKSNWKSGCLADDAASRKTAPDFSLDPKSREAIRIIGRTSLVHFNSDSAPEIAERQMTALRCAACHTRDGHEDTWGTLADEIQKLESTLGGEPEQRDDLTPDQNRPHLTWIGEKLNRPWMESFIAGQIKYKPRPWIFARMPAFPAHAKTIATGLSLEHGITPNPAAPIKPDDKLAQLGKQLVGREGGFSCVSCHGVGDMKPVGAFETVGINFMHVKDRIRQDYYTRWMQDPQRVEPGTRMPRFGNPDGTSDLKTILDGDLKKQIDAMWNYLMTSPNLTPPE